MCLILREFLRTFKIRVPLPSHANDLIDRSPFPEGPSAWFDSTPLPWRAKRKRGARLSVGSADRPDLQRPYLNYSEKLISFFLPSPPRKPFERFRVWRGPRVQGESRNENDRPIAPSLERTGRVIRWTLPFVPLIILSPERRKRTHTYAHAHWHCVSDFSYRFSTYYPLEVLSAINRCICQMEYICIIYGV